MIWFILGYFVQLGLCYLTIKITFHDINVGFAVSLSLIPCVGFLTVIFGLVILFSTILDRVDLEAMWKKIFMIKE